MDGHVGLVERGDVALANAHKNKVKLTFFHGAELPDPKKLFNASLDGNKWRAIDFGEEDRIDQAALKALLRAAVAYNRQHSLPKSKGSRVQRMSSPVTRLRPLSHAKAFTNLRRRILVRWEKNAANYEAMLALACATRIVSKLVAG